MTAHGSILELQVSPHLHTKVNVSSIMLHVVYSIVPVCLFGVYQFGWSALALIVTTTLSCLLTERVVCWAAGKPSTLGDCSALITGLLLALTLPPGLPLWMGAVGGVVSIALGKALFGGIGFNLFNPALVGRAFLQAAFPVAITTWTPAGAPQRFTSFVPSTFAWPFSRPASVDAWIAAAGVDGFTGATPLSLQKFSHIGTDIGDLFLGTTAGSIGETSALLILVCGIFLIWQGLMDWRIPTAVLGTAFITSLAFYVLNPGIYPSPAFMMFSGGLMLGAIFMATDMVGSPVTPLGVWIYGAVIGLVTVVIRLKGGLPDGVMYAILLGNALTPLIDQWTQPRIFGQRKKQHV
ncbi:MAG: RnfABCDGE type electron transport complex subunit D [Candidatus Hydrogenedentes bacterium]|nr:RnfABCDGE type electron transport complex subunit D [Candidatus Hydrogenedentota bacterium]